MEGGLNVQEYEVIFYDKTDGTEPAKDFILSLDKKMRAKMLRTISLLADNGPDLREPCSKPLGDGIFELRAKQSSDITRILNGFYGVDTPVLTHGFTKKTRKTPKNQIELARKYKDDYERRHKNEQV